MICSEKLEYTFDKFGDKGCSSIWMFVLKLKYDKWKYEEAERAYNQFHIVAHVVLSDNIQPTYNTSHLTR